MTNRIKQLGRIIERLEREIERSQGRRIQEAQRRRRKLVVQTPRPTQRQPDRPQ